MYSSILRSLQQYWENIQANNHNLKCENQKLEELQARRRQITELTEVESMHHQNVDTLQNDIDRLFNERRQLHQFVSKFKNGNDKYLKIKDVAAEEVNRLLTEQEPLLDLALNAVIEALRMNPERYAVIYNIKYDSDDNTFDSSRGTNTAAAISPPYTASTSTKPDQNHYYNEYHEGLVEMAKGFLNILSSQLVDKTMFAVKGQ